MLKQLIFAVYENGLAGLWIQTWTDKQNGQWFVHIDDILSFSIPNFIFEFKTLVSLNRDTLTAMYTVLYVNPLGIEVSSKTQERSWIIPVLPRHSEDQ